MPRPSPRVNRPLGQALHGQGEAGGDHGVAGVVVGGGGDQPDALAGRTGRPAEHGRFLLVVALGDEGRSEPERLGALDLGHDVTCALGLAGQQIAGQLVEDLHRWSVAHGASRVGRPVIGRTIAGRRYVAPASSPLPDWHRSVRSSTGTDVDTSGDGFGRMDGAAVRRLARHTATPCTRIPSSWASWPWRWLLRNPSSNTRPCG